MRRGVWLGALLLLAQAAWGGEQRATILYYRMGEAGIEPYLSRILITADHLRIDEGNSDDNYLLFDRKGRTLHNVVHGERTILDIPFRPVERQPALPLGMQSRVIDEKTMPLIAGHPPLHRELRINDTLCYSVISAQLLPDAVQALRDYRGVMAGEHAKNLERTPVELQSPCELALHIFSPLWLLEQGLPVQEWSPQGRTASLLDFKQEERVDDGLFLLPNGYRHYQTLDGE